jgi:hypothetical protein
MQYPIDANLDRYISWSVYALCAAVALAGVWWLVKTAFGRSAKSEENVEVPVEEVPWPKCEACSTADATEPKPVLVATRTGWLRFVFGMFALAPMYRRQVRRLGLEVRPEDLAFCAQCAPLADALTDRFVMTNVRAKLAKVNEEIAIDVNSFAREGLVAQMRSTLGSRSAVGLAPVSKLMPRTVVPPVATGTDP